VLAGEPVLSQHVELLARMLGDHPLAGRLELGLAERNSIVGLTTEDRDMLIGLLDPPPSGLAALHSALLRQSRMSPRRPPNY
jgi:hypothetical protein